jgi:hypothetical protein
MTLAVLVLGLVTLSFANSLPSIRLKATGQELCATLKRMRAIAQNRGEDQVLTLDLDTRQYGPHGRNMRRIPENISIRIDDSEVGEVRNGKYFISFPAIGGVSGGTITLRYKNKSVTIQTDPILGAVVV